MKIFELYQNYKDYQPPEADHYKKDDIPVHYLYHGTSLLHYVLIKQAGYFQRFDDRILNIEPTTSSFEGINYLSNCWEESKMYAMYHSVHMARFHRKGQFKLSKTDNAIDAVVFAFKVSDLDETKFFPDRWKNHMLDGGFKPTSVLDENIIPFRQEHNLNDFQNYEYHDKIPISNIYACLHGAYIGKKHLWHRVNLNYINDLIKDMKFIK